jgi:hypothetical protein
VCSCGIRAGTGTRQETGLPSQVSALFYSVSKRKENQDSLYKNWLRVRMTKSVDTKRNFVVTLTLA